MRFPNLISLFGVLSRRRRINCRRAQPRSGWSHLLLEPLEDRHLLAYAITDLGAWQAYGLNNNGQAVGSSNGSAVVWQNGTTTAIGSGTAVAINDAGEVAGYSGNAFNPNGFAWDAMHGFANLGGLPNNYVYSQPTDLNESGQLVGAAKWSYDTYDYSEPFLWGATSGMQALQSFNDFNTATAINEAGQIVGWSMHSISNGQYQSSQSAFFRDSDGTTTVLAALPGWPYSEAFDINDLGQAVGSSGDLLHTPNHYEYRPQQAFLWQNGVMTGLGEPAGYTRSQAVAINNAGQVVVLAYSSTTASSIVGHPFLWQNGAWTDLGPYDAMGVGINDYGQIVVRQSGSGAHSYLLTPDTITTLKINDVSVIEGDSGTVMATLTVTRTGPLDQTSTVGFMTADGTAKAGKDYLDTAGTLTFNPGEATQTISVPVLGDAVDEADETFYVNLNSATGAFLADGKGVGTIVDNDPPPALAINDVKMLEGNSGVSYFIFTVSLSTVSEKTISVNYATSDGTATSSGKSADYQATIGSLTFAPGETTKTISIAVFGDKRKEGDETFFLNLAAAVDAIIGDGQGLGTILNDD